MGENVNKYSNNGARAIAPKRTMASEALKSMRTATAERAKEKRDTDSGMTAPQKAKVLALEKQIQARDTEKGYIVDAKGNVVGETIKGSNNQAVFELRRGSDFSDAILVHNHPSVYIQTYESRIDFAKREIKRRGVTRGATAMARSLIDATHPRTPDSLTSNVGVTLSDADIFTAARNNMKGVRAQSQGGYLYSLERGANGWGASPETLSRKWREYHNEESAKIRGPYYARKSNDWREAELRNARVEVVAQHRALKRLADEYGLKYTRRKS